MTRTPKLDAALAAWVAADKEYQAALRLSGGIPEHTKEAIRLAWATRTLADHEQRTRERVLAILNPEDHAS